MEVPVIRAATRDERQAVLDVLTLAFATDPLARWAAPGAKQYPAAFRRVTRRTGASTVPGTARVAGRSNLSARTGTRRSTSRISNIVSITLAVWQR